MRKPDKTIQFEIHQGLVCIRWKDSPGIQRLKATHSLDPDSNLVFEFTPAGFKDLTLLELIAVSRVITDKNKPIPFSNKGDIEYTEQIVSPRGDSYLVTSMDLIPAIWKTAKEHLEDGKSDNGGITGGIGISTPGSVGIGAPSQSRVEIKGEITIADGDVGVSQLLTSPDGINWTAQENHIAKMQKQIDCLIACLIKTPPGPMSEYGDSQRRMYIKQWCEVFDVDLTNKQLKNLGHCCIEVAKNLGSKVGLTSVEGVGLVNTFPYSVISKAYNDNNFAQGNVGL